MIATPWLLAATAAMLTVVPQGPKPPLLEFLVAADRAHDAEAAARVLAPAGEEEPPAGYRWAEAGGIPPADLEGLIVRPGGDGKTRILLKVAGPSVTEKDLARVDRAKDDRGEPTLRFTLTEQGGTRMGELTRAHLPTDGGKVSYRLAIVVEGKVVTAPSIRTAVGREGSIEFGGRARVEEFDRVFGLLERAARANPPAPAREVPDQAGAIREAKAVDLPLIAGADRVVIAPAGPGEAVTLREPGEVAGLVRALVAAETPPSAGERAATLTFFRGETPLRRAWIYEEGEWGFDRPGTRWTTGQSPALWDLVRNRLAKPRP